MKLLQTELEEVFAIEPRVFQDSRFFVHAPVHDGWLNQIEIYFSILTERVSSKVYDAIAQAAELTGASLNQFLVQSAYGKTQEVIEQERFIKMTVRSATEFRQFDQGCSRSIPGKHF